METITNATELSEELQGAYETYGYENRILSQKEAIKMLDMHGMAWHINADGLFTDDSDSYSDDNTNIVNWSLFDMLAFLGY